MQFINPAYLTEKTQAVLFERFGDDSHVLLSGLLRKEFVEALEKALRAQDAKDGFAWWERGQGEEGVRLPKHGTGLDAGGEGKTAWTTVGPPHRQRYLALAQPTSAGESTSIVSTSTKLPSPLPSSASELLSLLSTILFPSPAFRHFIANVSQLVPIASRPVEARRFRPGLDYTLARADQEAILDVTLCLTPDVAGPFLETERKAGPKGLGGKAKAGGANKRAKTSTANGESASGLSKKSAKQLATKWESGEVGGWECYMAPHEGEEDPAVYQSGGAKKSAQSNGDDEADKGEGSSKANGGDDEGWEDEEMENGADGKQGDGEAVDEDEDEDDEDEDDEDDEDFDGVLLNLTPSFNTLSIALRDEGVMRFVKYLAASAGGSRWDVSAEFTAGAVEEENDEEAEA